MYSQFTMHGQKNIKLCKKLVYVNNTEENCRELAMYLSNVLGVQNVRRDKG